MKTDILREISGGVCAPAGFRANGFYCGICKEYAEREDVALIVADGAYPTACVYSNHSLKSATATVSARHLKNGRARAVFINSGVANACLDDGEKIAESVCDTLAARLIISRNEIVIASTGKITGEFPLDTVQEGIKPLVSGLGYTEEHATKVARAIMTTDTTMKQVAFEFDLGDYPCKIGAVFKGRYRVCPNMSTTLCVLTTDVRISPEMLRKALSAACAETLNQMNLDGAPSPNDTVCIMASGKAGNYIISQADTEYRKFYLALEAVLKVVCRRIVSDGAEKTYYCRVQGARSKRAARAIANAVAGSIAIREGLKKGELSLANILAVIGGTGEYCTIQGSRVSLYSEKGSIVLMEDGKPLIENSIVVRNILQARTSVVSIVLRNGNYPAESIFGI